MDTQADSQQSFPRRRDRNAGYNKTNIKTQNFTINTQIFALGSSVVQI